MPLSSLHKRIITSVILLLTLTLALVYGGAILTATVVLFSSIALYEFYTMFFKPKHEEFSKLAGLTAGAAIILASYYGSTIWATLILIVSFWFFNFDFLFSYSSNQEKADYKKSLIIFSGLLYIPFTLQFITTMTASEIIFVFLSSSASDTIAYYAGTKFGKTKIWPTISPKKSWVGSISGLLACILCCTTYGFYLGHAPLLYWTALAIALNIASQMGDFFESALKRKLNVKDSGKILPGHGGVLDRIDSLVVALPVYIIARELFHFF